MRTISASVVGLLIAGLCACFTSTASAQPLVPALCNTTREVRQFLLGVRKGRSLAQQAIAAVEATSGEDDICQDLEAVADLQDLIQGIVDALDVPDAPSEAAQCHLQGQVAGLVAEVIDLQDTCVDVCIADGEFIGAISAFLYCELSVALGGLELAELFERLATTLCGEQFEDACDATFFSTAATTASCVPFTIAPFDDVFEQTQNNQCASNPED
jgi:hypothetical protein